MKVWDGFTDLGMRRAVMAGITPETASPSAVDDPAPSPPAIDRPVTAVVLAGGEGQRLRPLTDKVPKSLLMVGRTTILERVLESLKRSGIEDVWLSVNYKAEMIEERVGDGSAHGLRVRYLRERTPLHTAGCLSLLPERPAGPIVMTNADQVTSLDFARMVEYHLAEGVAVTIGSIEHETHIPYGVLDVNGRRLAGMREKPVLRTRCNAGIYVLDPAVVDLVPPNTRFGVDRLLAAVVEAGKPVGVFPILEQWIDVGTPEELEKALLWFATGEEV